MAQIEPDIRIPVQERLTIRLIAQLRLAADTISMTQCVAQKQECPHAPQSAAHGLVGKRLFATLPCDQLQRPFKGKMVDVKANKNAHTSET
jgi:hypothetical protein